MAVEWMLGAFGGAKALGLPDAAVDLLDKALKACAGAEGKMVLDQVKARLRAYSGSAPVNDDLDRAIRLAELTAGLMLVDRFCRQVDLEILETRGATPPPFIEKARSHLFDQIGLCPGFQVKPNALLIREIEAGLDRALAEPAAVEQAMGAAASRAFADLVAAAGPAPEDFETWYRGRRAGEPGWAILAVAFLRETVKAKPAVETEFVLSRLAGVRECLRGLVPKIDEVKEVADAILDNQDRTIAALNAFVSQAGILNAQEHSAYTKNIYMYDTMAKEKIQRKIIALIELANLSIEEYDELFCFIRSHLHLHLSKELYLVGEKK